MSPQELPYWPLLMNAKLASSYVGMAYKAFLKTDVPKVYVGKNVVRYHIEDLNHFVDSLRTSKAETNNGRIISDL